MAFGLGVIEKDQASPPVSGSEVEARLEDQIREWEDFAKSARDWLWKTDAEGRFTYISEQYQDVCGDDPDYFLGMTREETVERYLDPAAAEKILADIAENKPFRDLVFKRRCENGREVWVRSSGVPSFDADGRFTGYRGAGSDLTEFVTTWERRNQLAMLLHSAPFGMMMLDQDLRIQLANAALWDFVEAVMPDVKIGSSMADFIRKGIQLGFVDTADQDEDVFISDRLRQIVQGPSTVERHLMGGSYEIRSNPLPDGSILFYFIDVSEQRRLRDRLLQTQRIEAMGHLTAGIAHDFNNLMEVILGSLELLKADPTSKEAHDLIGMAQRATERGADLTGQLLSFSGEAKLSPQLIQIAEVIRGIEPRLRQVVPRSINLEFILGDNLLSAWMDPGQFEVALTNLVENACDAMPKGGNLVILAENRSGGIPCGNGPDLPVMEDEHVSVSVIDSGIGMSSALQEKAREPFFTTKEVGQGSGLGLSMVHGFTMQSSGHFTIDSALNNGTTVRLCFPGFIERRTSAPRNKAGLEAAPETAHILVVEDTDDVRAVIRRQLEREGYRVSDAMAGAEALDLLRNDPSISLILSDVVMSGEFQGPELLYQARQLYPGIRTMLMSGYPRSSVGNQCPLPADTRLLAKPMSNQELLDAVTAVLAEPALDQDSWTRHPPDQPSVE
ncbi:MAG: ATP-binding protein [Pseudomonadota bacterium]